MAAAEVLHIGTDVLPRAGSTGHMVMCDCGIIFGDTYTVACAGGWCPGWGAQRDHREAERERFVLRSILAGGGVTK